MVEKKGRVGISPTLHGRYSEEWPTDVLRRVVRFLLYSLVKYRDRDTEMYRHDLATMSASWVDR